MHFIQNSWFVVYSVWVLLFLLGALGIISYINNRTRVLKKLAITFTLTLVLAVSVSIQRGDSRVNNDDPVQLNSIQQGGNDVESPSILNNAFRFLGSVMRNRLAS